MKELMTPFSNGSEAMDWYGRNCDNCTKAYHPGETCVKFKTLQNYVSIGKYCKYQFHIDMGFITSEIPVEIAEGMGYKKENIHFPDCIHFSDNSDDGYKPDKRCKPTGPLNQMTMPFFVEEFFNEKQLV